MVICDNDIWEFVGQFFNFLFEEGKCYEFSIKLVCLFFYYSVSCERNVFVNYVELIKFCIWVGFGMCDKCEMFDELLLISNVDWQEFKFKFEFGGNYMYFILEVFYKMLLLFFFNGNLLLDDVFVIWMIFCDILVFDGL